MIDNWKMVNVILAMSGPIEEPKWLLKCLSGPNFEIRQWHGLKASKCGLTCENDLNGR